MKTRNRKKMLIIMGIGVGLVTLGGVALSLFNLPWASRLSHWPQVPPPELYVTTQPKTADIPGIYQLAQQTISTNGLAILAGRSCQLDLRPDWSFALTNYPQWSQATTPQVAGFISTTGRWHSATLGIVHLGQRSQSFWGVEFSDSNPRIDSLAFRGKKAPYALMLTYGDGDDGTVMLFERK